MRALQRGKECRHTHIMRHSVVWPRSLHSHFAPFFLQPGFLLRHLSSFVKQKWFGMAQETHTEAVGVNTG
jgi:hypothetical protein